MDFVQEINSSGGEIYLVGGTVRDRLFTKLHGLKKDPKDYDLLARLLPTNELEKILSKHGRLKEVGKSFGIITFTPKKGALKGINIDVALPRKEQSTGPGYRDFEIVSDEKIELVEDLSRRDFTMNAIVYKLDSVEDIINPNVDESKLIDMYGGVDDIKSKVLKAVGDAYHRFLEDPTRIMRALRQKAQLDLAFEKTTEENIIVHCDLIKSVFKDSPCRLAEELTRLLQSNECIDSLKFIVEKTQIFNTLGIVIADQSVLYDKIRLCCEKNYPIAVRFAVLLENIDGYAWAKRVQLSAAPHYPKEDIDFLGYATSVISVELNEISIKRLLQKVDKCKNQNLSLLWNYRDCCNRDGNDMKIAIEKCQDVPRTTNEIKLSGKILMTSYGIEPKMVGKIKTKILELVTCGLLNNDENLEEYVRKNLAELKE